MLPWHIKKISITSSTNDEAKQAAECGAAEGFVVWSLQQSLGRGRQGRQWQSPEGNLYFSVLLRPKTSLREWGLYSFVASLAISDVVRGLLPHALVELKWPNDVLVNGKKISGILLESGNGWLVVGMGLNVQHVPETSLYPVTSLCAESAVEPQLKEVLDNVLASLREWYVRMNNDGFAAIRAAWLSQARKGAMRVRVNQGEIHGQFADLDEEGNLRLILEDRTEMSISAGDVFF